MIWLPSWSNKYATFRLSKTVRYIAVLTLNFCTTNESYSTAAEGCDTVFNIQKQAKSQPNVSTTIDKRQFGSKKRKCYLPVKITKDTETNGDYFANIGLVTNTFRSSDIKINNICSVSDSNVSLLHHLDNVISTSPSVRPYYHYYQRISPVTYSFHSGPPSTISNIDCRNNFSGRSTVLNNSASAEALVLKQSSRSANKRCVYK